MTIVAHQRRAVNGNISIDGAPLVGDDSHMDDAECTSDSTHGAQAICSPSTETVAERIARLECTDISDARLDTLTVAHPIVDDATFRVLADAVRVARRSTMVLPAHRYQGLSRGHGWARLGRGGTATWAEANDDGNYPVGPGKWTVGSNDGYNRKGETKWVVKHVKVGEHTWTIAS